MTRKEFLAKLGMGAGVLIIAPVILNSCEESENNEPSDNGSDDSGGDDKVDFTIDLTNDDNSDLNQEGGYVYQNDIIIAYLGNEEYIALSKICTHQGCTVEYDHAGGQIECDCHGSVFSQTGSVIEGPAEDALKEYNTELNGQDLRIYE